MTYLRMFIIIIIIIISSSSSSIIIISGQMIGVQPSCKMYCADKKVADCVHHSAPL